jgi:hypothetical protein
MTLTVDIVQLDIIYRSLELMQDRVPPLPDEEQPSLADLFKQIEDLKTSDRYQKATEARGDWFCNNCRARNSQTSKICWNCDNPAAA